MIASLALTGMIFVVSAGLFGAYVLGFRDGIKECDDESPSSSRRM
jgi:hypothetical protein